MADRSSVERSAGEPRDSVFDERAPAPGLQLVSTGLWRKTDAGGSYPSEIPTPEGCLFSLPPWTPPGVAIMFGVLTASVETEQQATVLLRFRGDRRMERAWGEIFRSPRNEQNRYLHPARWPEQLEPVDPYRSQQAAAAETLRYAYLMATSDIATATPEELAREHARLLADAARLRREAGAIDPHGDLADIVQPESLLRAAAQKEEAARTLRPIDDLWAVERHRGDRLMDAMGAALGMYFRERYGSPMYRVAATFTAVAFGASKRNPRAVRSGVQRYIQRHGMAC
jgi:hypothetical protein